MARKSRWPVFTEEWAQKIVDEYLEILCLNWMLYEGCYAFYEVNDRRFHVIYLRNNFSREVDSARYFETFVHELIHLFHSIWGLPVREKRVERESVQFFSEHDEFVIRLLEELKASQKCLRHSSPGDSPEDLEGFLAPEEMVLSILRQKYGQS